MLSNQTLKKLNEVINFEPPLIRNFVRRYQHCDEPQFYQYAASVLDGQRKLANPIYNHTGSGFSFFSDKIARIKCLAESLERFCSEIYDESEFTYSNFKELDENAIDPIIFSPFLASQLEFSRFKQFDFDETTKFNWCQAYLYPSLKTILLPAQLIYTRFIDKDEKIIRLPISTGAAGGFTLSSALYRGICEIVERDSFMIMYMNKVCRCKVNLENIQNPKIQFILKKAHRYLLDIQVFDITTDLGIPSFMSLVIDRSGYGLAISVGLKSDLDSEKSILGAMQESFHTRSWIRTSIEDGEFDPMKIKPSEIRLMKERGAYWFPKERISLLDYYVQLPKSDQWTKSVKKSKSDDELLKTIADILNKNNVDIYFKNLTTNQIEKIDFCVVKVLLPKLQPLYLDERYPYFGNERIYNTPLKIGLKNRTTKFLELNLCPHPFL